MKRRKKVLYKKIAAFIFVAAMLALTAVLSIFLLDLKKGREFYANEDKVAATDDKTLCSCPADNNLPIIVIDTKGQNLEDGLNDILKKASSSDIVIFDKAPKYKALFTLYEVGDNGYTSICGKEEPALRQSVIIGIRGQSSFSTPKKQYGFKFINEDGSEVDKRILDMPAGSDWVLNGSYADKSLIRNYVAYSISDEIMEYAPRARFCEVYMREDASLELSKENYMGVYLIIEKIKRSPERVDIRKSNEKYSDQSFIIARDKIKNGDNVIKTLWGSLQKEHSVGDDGLIRPNSVIVGVYPGMTSMTEAQKSYITDYINKFEYALNSKNFKDPHQGYRRYIDVNSFVDYAIINELFMNYDGGSVSTYFYKDIGGLLKAGPVWDFDLILGNSTAAKANGPTGFRMYNTIWYNQLFKDPYFVKVYKKRYLYLRKNILSDKNLMNSMDNTVKMLGKAEGRNTEKWYSAAAGTTGIDSPFNYNQEIMEMKKFLLERAKWMDENLIILNRFDDTIE